MPDNTLSTLEQIRIKVRRLTRSPSTAQITDATINNYINIFILYDFPEHLKTFKLNTTLTFYTEPYIATYSGDDIVTNFNNLYSAVYKNVYIAGYKALFSQNRDEFFSLYPKTELKKDVGTGNGVLSAFGGTLSSVPVLRNHVLFTSIDANNEGIKAYDDGSSNIVGDVTVGAINYITGVYAFTFTTPPGNGETVYSQTVPYKEGLPSTILYYDNEFTFRPVPDQSYRVELEVAQRPTELLQDANMPEISQWWQYIAYGAAKKIFEDRMDTESLTKIIPEFKQQELLVNRRTIDQQSKQRVATIYSIQNTLNCFNE